MPGFMQLSEVIIYGSELACLGKYTYCPLRVVTVVCSRKWLQNYYDLWDIDGDGWTGVTGQGGWERSIQDPHTHWVVRLCPAQEWLAIRMRGEVHPMASAVDSVPWCRTASAQRKGCSMKMSCGPYAKAHWGSIETSGGPRHKDISWYLIVIFFYQELKSCYKIRRKEIQIIKSENQNVGTSFWR